MDEACGGVSEPIEWVEAGTEYAAVLMEEMKKLEIEIKKFKVPATKRENEAAEDDEETNTLLAFETHMSKETKSIEVYREPNNIPAMEIRLCSWRGMVSEEPEIHWNIQNVLSRQIYRKQFFVGKYPFDCEVQVQLPSTPEPRQPFLKVLVKLVNQREVPLTMPTIVAVINNKESQISGTETLDVVSWDGGSSFRYDSRRPMCSEPVAIGIPSKGLSVQLYFELPWSVEEVQSENGVLYWTVKNVSQLLRRDDRKLSSPLFRTDNGNGYLMRAVLYHASTENELKLGVVNCSLPVAVSHADYVVTVIVFRPKRADFKWIKSRRSDLKRAEIFGLGKFEDVVVSEDTLFCKVLVWKPSTSA